MRLPIKGSIVLYGSRRPSSFLFGQVFYSSLTWDNHGALLHGKALEAPSPLLPFYSFFVGKAEWKVPGLVEPTEYPVAECAPDAVPWVPEWPPEVEGPCFADQGTTTGSSFKAIVRPDTIGTAVVAAVKLAEFTSATTYPVADPPAVPVTFPESPKALAPTSQVDSGTDSEGVDSAALRGNAPSLTSTGSDVDTSNEVYM